MTVEKNSASTSRPTIGQTGISVSYQWSSASTVPTPTVVLTRQRFYQGYINGFRQPLVKLELRINTVSAMQKQNLLQALAIYFPEITHSELAASFANVLSFLQKQSGFPIFESVKIDMITDNDVTLWIPVLFDGCLLVIVELLLKLFNHHLQENPSNISYNLQIENLIKNLKQHAPQGANSLRLLEAAFELNIPWAHVSLNTFQYGYGINSRWLSSTFTDETPYIAAKLTENKRTITILLKNHGFPLPEQVVVIDEADALQHAERLTYPVVIKPIDQSGGKGVYSNLMSASSLNKAFKIAKQVYPTLLLEKHIPGKDYRILVLNGKMFWAIERIPAGVKGDGIHTIKSLIDLHNQENKAMPLRHIKISQDTIDYLAERQLTLDSIIANERFIALNRVANISAGGTPHAVFDKVHPDNKRLMEAAAQLLRLDFVGIDFISEDIAVSYTENGGKILEVNAQPLLGSTTSPYIYHEILTTLTPQPRRIPISVIYKNAMPPGEKLYSDYKKIGLAKNNTAYINNEKLIETTSIFEAGRHLLLRNDINCLVYCIDNDEEINAHGLPFDRYDQLYIEKEVSKPETLLKACLAYQDEMQ